MSNTYAAPLNALYCPMHGILYGLRHRPLYYGFVGLFWGTAVPIFINDNILEINYITGESMTPTLSPNCKETGEEDVVLWKKWNATKALRRGDVVHFMNPLRPEAFAVKRIVGVQGDTVLLDRRRRPKAREGPEPPTARAWDEWKGMAQVPPGHVWVEGDNWRESHDSNYYGPISASLITGRAVSIVWPVWRFWTKPWEGFEGRTKVIEHEGKMQDWTEGLPVELAEIENPHAPP